MVSKWIEVPLGEGKLRIYRLSMGTDVKSQFAFILEALKEAEIGIYCHSQFNISLPESNPLGTEKSAMESSGRQ